MVSYGSVPYVDLNNWNYYVHVATQTYKDYRDRLSYLIGGYYYKPYIGHYVDSPWYWSPGGTIGGDAAVNLAFNDQGRLSIS